jgi:hypothetical protein
MPDRKTEKERHRKKKEDDGSQDESKLIHAPNYAWVANSSEVAGAMLLPSEHEAISHSRGELRDAVDLIVELSARKCGEFLEQ